MFKALERFRQFRDKVYQAFEGSRDAVFEMIDAIASSPNARSAVEISLSGCMERKFSSVYKGLERTKINVEHLKVTLQRTAETAGQLMVCGYLVYSLDHTPYPRQQARTVADRGVVHGGAWGRGSSYWTSIFVAYSLLGRVMHAEGAWVGITQCERIPTSQTPTQVGGAQIAWLKANTLWPSIVTADCEYLTKDVLDQVDPDDKKVCLLIRMKGNRVLYHAPRVPKRRKRGRPRLHGQRLKLNQPKTLGKPDARVSVSAADDAEGWIEIAVWKNVHVKSHPQVSGCAIRVTAYRAHGQPKFKRPMWLFWTGWPDMDWPTFWKTYLKRYCIESVHQFSKNSLAWTRARLGDTDHEERWSWLVMLAYWQLVLAAPIAQDCYRPWEKPIQVGRLPTPARVQRDYPRIFAQVGTPAQAPKPRGIPPGRPIGFRPAPRPRFPVIIKS